MCDCEVELDVELRSMRVKPAASESQLFTLELFLEKEKKVSEEMLAGLETMANDTMITPYAKLT